ncbi:MAG: hypothetical protein ACE144_02170 [Thermodesulfobacteriota bacterium]
MSANLLQALEASDVTGASEKFKEEILNGRDPWEIHLSLFPVAMRVLNPPFVNAHLPKMYAICSDLVPYLKREEVPALVQLEINEYARRPLLEKLSRPNRLPSPVSFGDVESAIREEDWEKTAVLMAAFYEQKGGKELSRRFLLLGSGYLSDSLGHSFSCASFILLKTTDPANPDPWPVLTTLAHFFCKAKFHTTLPLGKSKDLREDETLYYPMVEATEGLGILRMHHTITRYAMERARHLFSEEEYDHLIGAWTAFIEKKGEEKASPESRKTEPVTDYARFYEIFSGHEPKAVVAALSEMIASRKGRKELGRFLIKGLCDHYPGHYDPHCLTGLGSALWTMEQYSSRPPIPLNALFQYVDFYFSSVRSSARPNENPIG